MISRHSYCAGARLDREQPTIPSLMEEYMKENMGKEPGIVFVGPGEEEFEPDHGVLGGIDGGEVEKESMASCPHCGMLHSGTTVGAHKKTDICPECLFEKQQEARHKTIMKNRMARAKRMSDALSKYATIPELSIVVDFSEYPELHKAIVDQARDQVRTPSQQALYIMKLWET